MFLHEERDGVTANEGDFTNTNKRPVGAWLILSLRHETKLNRK